MLMKNNGKTILGSAFLFAVYYWMIFAVTLLISSVLGNVTRFATSDLFVQDLVLVISMFLISAIGVFILFYKIGYKSNSKTQEKGLILNLVISAVGAYIILFLAELITKFAPIVNGFTVYFSFLVTGISDLAQLRSEQYPKLVLSFLGYMACIFVITFLSFKAGYIRRDKTRLSNNAVKEN